MDDIRTQSVYAQGYPVTQPAITAATPEQHLHIQKACVHVVNLEIVPRKDAAK